MNKSPKIVINENDEEKKLSNFLNSITSIIMTLKTYEIRYKDSCIPIIENIQIFSVILKNFYNFITDNLHYKFELMTVDIEEGRKRPEINIIYIKITKEVINYITSMMEKCSFITPDQLDQNHFPPELKELKVFEAQLLNITSERGHTSQENIYKVFFNEISYLMSKINIALEIYILDHLTNHDDCTFAKFINTKEITSAIKLMTWIKETLNANNPESENLKKPIGSNLIFKNIYFSFGACLGIQIKNNNKINCKEYTTLKVRNKDYNIIKKNKLNNEEPEYFLYENILASSGGQGNVYPAFWYSNTNIGPSIESMIVKIIPNENLCNIVPADEEIDLFTRLYNIKNYQSHSQKIPTAFFDLTIDNDSQQHRYLPKIPGCTIAEAVYHNLLPKNLCDIAELCRQFSEQLYKLHFYFRAIHSDIKPDNVIVYQNKKGEWVLQLIDFGSTHKLEQQQVSPNSLENHYFKADALKHLVWMTSYIQPPEIKKKQEMGISQKSDIYGALSVLLSLFGVTNPFYEKDEYIYGSYSFEQLSPEIENRKKPLLHNKIYVKIVDEKTIKYLVKDMEKCDYIEFGVLLKNFEQLQNYKFAILKITESRKHTRSKNKPDFRQASFSVQNFFNADMIMPAHIILERSKIKILVFTFMQLMQSADLENRPNARELLHFFTALADLSVPLNNTKKITENEQLKFISQVQNIAQMYLLANRLKNFKDFEEFLGNGIINCSHYINARNEGLLNPIMQDFSNTNIESLINNGSSAFRP